MARAAARRQAGRTTRTVIVICVVGLAVFTQFTVWIPMGAALQRSFPVAGVHAAALAGAALALGWGVGSLLVGPLADRFGRWPVLYGGLLVLAAATLVAALSPTWPVHLAARGVQGLAGASLSPTWSAWIADHLPPARRTVALGWLTTAYRAAAPVGVIYAKLIMERGSWRMVYAGLALVYAASALVLSYRFRDPAAAPAASPADERHAAEQVGGAYRRLARLPSLRVVVGCWLLALISIVAFQGMYAGLERELPARYGLAPQRLLLVQLLGMIGILAAPLLLTALARVRAASMIAAGVLAMAVGMLLQAATPPLVVMVAASALVAGANTVALPPMASLITQLAPTTRATALAVWSFCLAVGAAVGGALPDWMAASHGYAGFSVLVAVAMILGTIGFLGLAAGAPAAASTLPPQPGRASSSAGAGRQGGLPAAAASQPPRRYLHRRSGP
jgi:YNFM family putative membrane transporter